MPSSEYELVSHPTKRHCANCIMEENCSNRNFPHLRLFCKVPWNGSKRTTVMHPLVLVHKLTGEIVDPKEIVNAFK